MDEATLENFLIQFRQDLHQHPELSTKEYETTAKIRQILLANHIGSVAKF